jgi:hypothetical protein
LLPDSFISGPASVPITVRLDLLRYNLKAACAYTLKEETQQLWDYNSAIWAASSSTSGAATLIGPASMQ